MKIGALVHMYPPMHNAGAEHMLHAMLSDLIKRGHEAVVVVHQGQGYAQIDFEPYTLDGVRVSKDRRTLRGSDVMITHLDRTKDAEVWCKKHGVPLVHVFHNHLHPQLAKRCDLAVYNSEHLLKHAPLQLCDAPSMVVHPPIWPEHYRVPEEKHERRYITLINLSAPKGAEMFYAMAQMFPREEFLGVKGSYGKQVLPSSPMANVTIIENQPDIRKVYAQTKILLMPSSYESYGRCAVEASCSGIPVIANPTRGLREALEVIGEGGLFPLPDSDSWACAIKYTLETYPARVRDAYRVAQYLDPDSEMDNFEKALLCLLH